MSRSLWIPTIWALVAFSRPLGLWFGNTEPGSMEAGSSLDRAFLTILLCFAIFVLSKRRFNWPIAIRENFWLILLLGFMLISIFWSPMPYTSFKRWTRELIAVVMAFLILSERDPRQALVSILRRISYVLIPYSLLLIKYYPKYGIEYGRWSGEMMWRGVTTQKNGLTLLCVISALFLFWTLIRRRRGGDIPVAKYQTYFELFLLVSALFLFLGPRRTPTYSATSAVVFAAALLALAGFYWLKKRRSALGIKVLKVIIVTIVVYGTITPFLGKLSILDISSTLKRDGTLTGRSEIWAVLVPFALSRPVMGHGIGGFWTTEMRRLTSSHAHNGYLDIILDLGFLGLLLMSMLLLSCCRKVHRAITYDFDWGILFVCYLIMVPVHNIAESSINSLASSLTAIVIFFSVSTVSGEEETPVKVMPQPEGP
ncbi:MAG: O-antigen ligase family protein [Planctomycetes bacterium]|nr:O-antigen ligase family protein [Planctomycetota bacterium]